MLMLLKHYTEKAKLFDASTEELIHLVDTHLLSSKDLCLMGVSREGFALRIVNSELVNRLGGYDPSSAMLFDRRGRMEKDPFKGS